MATTEQILGLTIDLIQLQSTKENAGALRQVIELAKSELSEYPFEEFSGEVENDQNEIVAHYPSILSHNSKERPEKFRILLHGHLDVVPAQNQKQFTPTECDRRLYGRGAQDMKSGAATLISVFRERAKTLPYPIGLSLTTDEEIGGFKGAGHQAAQGIDAEFVISGESTNFSIGNEHKGVMILDLKTNTQGGHTAYDGDQANAAQKMVNFLDGVNKLYPGPDQKWRTTSSVTEIGTSNQAHNVVPSDATAQLSFRWIPQDNPKAIIDRVQALDPRIELRRGPFGEAHETKKTHPDVQLLAKAIKQATGNPAQYVKLAGSSDLRHWTSNGAAGVDFGPIGAGLHTADEYIEIDSLGQYADILSAFLESIK